MGDRKRSMGVMLAILISSGLGACTHTASSSAPPMASLNPTVTPSPKPLEYRVHRLPRSDVHILTIPAQSPYEVTVAIAPQLQTVEAFAKQHQAIAVLNGGFFDPQNQKTTSAVIVDAQQVAKPEDNERLMTNPDLLPFLDKILNRSEFRRYVCSNTGSATMQPYAIARRQELPPPECQLQVALGAGPRLLPVFTGEPEGFLVKDKNTVVRDALGSQQGNARSAIGLRGDGSVVLVMAAQRPDVATKSGLSLPELAEFMQTLGVKQGLNLDGGSSASLFFQGETVYGKVNDQGQAIARPVKSVLLVKAIAR